jgi:double-stranded uracil-DNA glycosylase
MYVRSFDPIASSASTRLVLGTAPGIASLRAGEYYAHPRNAFWDIAETLLGIRRSLGYATRVALLRASGVALWDVLASCTRPTSMDADIAPGTIEANEFATFFSRQAAIRTIYFNGAGAAALYKRHVLPDLPLVYRGIQSYRLPSTSPANARLNMEAKVRAWAVLRRRQDQPDSLSGVS